MSGAGWRRACVMSAAAALLAVGGVPVAGVAGAQAQPPVASAAAAAGTASAAADAPSDAPPPVPSEAEVRAEVAPGEAVAVGIASVDAAGDFSVTARPATGPQAVLDVVATAAADPATVAVGLPQTVRTLEAGEAAAATVVPAASDPMRPDSTTRPWPWNQYAMDMLCADAVAAAQRNYRCEGHASQFATGKGQVVAVIDTGVDTAHPDLAAAILPGARCVLVTWVPCRSVAQTAPADVADHATHVAGIIAATAGNGIGVAGLAPDAKVLPVQVLASDGRGTTTDVAAGVTWAVDNGATVINMSIGTSGADTNDPVLAAAVANAQRLGVPVVAAAGNDGEQGSPISYPAAYPGVIGVAHIDFERTLASTSTRGTWVDVAAPGELVVSTVAGGYYGYLSGTSMATPHVAAAAALIRQLHPDSTPAQIGTAITATAEDVGPAGWDPGFGYGVVRPVAALVVAPQSAENAQGAEFHPIDPARVLDTRTGRAIDPRTARTVSVAKDIAGHPVVPDTAVAVAYNLTVPAPTTSGHLRVMPGNVGSSNASAINFVRGHTIANGLVVKTDAARTIRLFNAADQPVNAVLDIVGYFQPPGAAAGGGTGFTPVAPVRVYDADAAPEGAVAPGDTRNVSVTTGLLGQADVVPAGAAAIAYNLTVVGPTGAGHLRVMPGDVAASATSAINFGAGDTIANGLEVRLASDRSINVFNGSGVPVRFLVDVVGFYQVGGGALFHPVAPARVYDSRQPLPSPGVLAPGGQRSIYVGDGRDAVGNATREDAVPPGATALAYNVTVTMPLGATGGHLRMWPADREQPFASVINWTRAGSTRANGLVVGLSADRRVSVYNGSGDGVHVIVDALGYYQ